MHKSTNLIPEHEIMLADFFHSKAFFTCLVPHKVYCSICTIRNQLHILIVLFLGA